MLADFDLGWEGGGESWFLPLSITRNFVVSVRSPPSSGFLRKAVSFYHGTPCASHIHVNILISLQPVIRKHAYLDHISCIYPKDDFHSISLGQRILSHGGNGGILGYHEFIIVFSSPEPSGSQSELKVYPCSGIRHRRPSSTNF